MFYQITRFLLSCSTTFGYPDSIGDGASYYAPWWLLAMISLAGVALFTGSMHLARLIGQVHGALAKTMLVSE